MAYYGDNEVLFSPTVNTTVDLTLEIDENSTNDECPSAKAVYDFGQFINSGSDPIVNIKTGEVITTNDSGLKPLHGLNIYGKTTQAGTPTPDAPIDLLSVGDNGSFEIGIFGGNLYNGDFVNLGCSDYTTGVLKERETRLTFKDFVLLEAGQYYVQANARCIVMVYDENGVYLPAETSGAWSSVGGVTFTLSAKRKVKCTFSYSTDIAITIENLGAVTLTPKQSLEVPYTLHGLPVASGGNYTDANGQKWLCDEVDFNNKINIKRLHAVTFNGSEDWQLLTGGRVNLTVNSVYAPKSDLYAPSNAKCNITANIVSWAALSEPSVASVASVAFGNISNIAFKVTGYTESVEAWKAYLAENPVTIVYELKTMIFNSFPYERGFAGMYCPLSDAYEALHTNKPNTTIISEDNAGQRVAYVADPKLYIDNKITEIENAILSLGGNV